MEILRTLIIVIFGTLLTIGISVGTLMYGWGLEPVNWFWIILGPIVASIIAQVTVAIAGLKK